MNSPGSPFGQSSDPGSPTPGSGAPASTPAREHGYGATRRSARPTVALAVLLVAVAATGAAVGVTAGAELGGDPEGVANAPAGNAPTADDWTTFGNDTRNTGSKPHAVGPREAVKTIWQLVTPADVGSSPAVVDGTVYVGDDGGTLYAVDADTGEVRWRRSLVDSIDGAGPTVVDGTVYVSAGTMVFALNASTGELRWEENLGGFVDASPAVVNGRVYVDGGAAVFALDAETGNVRWRRGVGVPVLATPAVANGTVYVGDFAGRLHAFDAGTGQTTWSRDLGGVVGSPAVADGTVYVGDGSTGDRTFALDADTGEIEWVQPQADGVGTSPAVAGDTVYVASYAGRLSALDAATGEVEWTTEAFRGQIQTAPAVTAETVYVAGTYGYVYGVDADSGTQLWRKEVRANSMQSSPAVADGRVFVGSGAGSSGSLHAFAAPPQPGVERTPSVGTVGEPVTLDASDSSSPTSTVERYEWDLDGDGTFEREGPQVTATVEESGAAAVTVRLTDAHGVTTTHRVSVPVVAPDEVPLADEWTQFGAGPGNRGHNPDATGVVGDVRTRMNLSLGGAGVTHPVIADDAVYVGEFREPPDDSELLAVNASVGTTRWRNDSMHVTSGPPAVADGIVYVGTRGEESRLLTLDAEDRTFTAGVRAVDADDGSVVWQRDVGAVESTLGVTDDRVYAVTEGGTTFALDAGTGATVWRTDLGEEVRAGIAVGDDRAFVGTVDGTLYALDADDGSRAWNRSVGKPMLAPPTVADGGVYVVTTDLRLPGTFDTQSDGDDATVHAFDAATGAVDWRATTGAPTGPAVVDGTVYLGTEAGRVLALYAANGTERWRAEGYGPVASPAIANGTVYIGTDPEAESGVVAALDAATGDERWNRSVRGGVPVGPAVAGDRVYATTGTGRLVVFEGTAPTAPTASAAANRTVVDAGGTVSLNASASADDQALANVQWSLGDGTTATGPSLTHAYAEPGTYAVTLRVTDVAGHVDTDTLAIEVTDPGDDEEDAGDSGGGSGDPPAGGSGGGVPSGDDETTTATTTMTTTTATTATTTTATATTTAATTATTTTATDAADAGVTTAAGTTATAAESGPTTGDRTTTTREPDGTTDTAATVTTGSEGTPATTRSVGPTTATPANPTGGVPGFGVGPAVLALAALAAALARRG